MTAYIAASLNYLEAVPPICHLENKGVDEGKKSATHFLLNVNTVSK